MNKLKLLPVSFCLFLSTAAGAQEIQNYKDLCDASAAVPVPGSNVFLVANDESAIMHAYELNKSKVFDKVNLAKRLSNIREDTELELEAATTIADTSFWISSHARKNGARLDLDRHWLFALKLRIKDKKKVDADLVGVPYRDFLKDLVKDPRYKSLDLEDFSKKQDSSREPKTPNAFNIEGLTAWQGNKLLVGVRAPLLKNKAMLIPIENPFDVINGKKVKFGDLITLDLGGLGIRSIEYVPFNKTYYIVTGRYDRKPDHHLFTWTGNPMDAPKEIKDIDLKQLNPEAIFAFPGSNELQILSDDGKLEITKDGKKLLCGDALKQGYDVHFRATHYTMKN